MSSSMLVSIGIITLALAILTISAFMNVSVITVTIISFIIITICWGGGYSVYKLLYSYELKKARKKKKEIIYKYGEDFYISLLKTLNIDYLYYCNSDDSYWIVKEYNNRISQYLSKNSSTAEFRITHIKMLLKKLNISLYYYEEKKLFALLNRTKLVLTEEASLELINIFKNSLLNICLDKKKYSEDELRNLTKEIINNLKSLCDLSDELVFKNIEKEHEYINMRIEKINDLIKELTSEINHSNSTQVYLISKPITYTQFLDDIFVINKLLGCEGLVILEKNIVSELLKTNLSKNLIDTIKSLKIYIFDLYNTDIDLKQLSVKDINLLENSINSFNTTFNKYIDFLYSNQFFVNNIDEKRVELKKIGSLINSIREDVVNSNSIFK